MLYIVKSICDQKLTEQVPVLADQLQMRGHEVKIHTLNMHTTLSRNSQFDLSPFMTELPASSGDQVLLLKADEITTTTALQLKPIISSAAAIFGFGDFVHLQDRIKIRTLLHHCNPQVAELLSLKDLPLFGSRCPPAPQRSKRKPILICDAHPDIAEDFQLVEQLHWSQDYEPLLLNWSDIREKWRSSIDASLRCFHYGELLPSHLTSLADLVLLRQIRPFNYSDQSLFLNCLESGIPIYAPAAVEDMPWIMRAPRSVQPLLPMIDLRTELSSAILKDELTAQPRPQLDGGLLEKLAPPKAVSHARPKYIFMPTNGVGLGHAQRCALIAQDLQDEKPIFAAFPSCLPMLQTYGFDALPLVSRTGFHRQSHENDLLNRLRLKEFASHNGKLIFDGGYVFDSVMRTILDHRLTGIWIRRGMWQTTQDNSIALEREKIFQQVIVPSEAFEELNDSYSQGEHIHVVGPIVQETKLSPKKKQKLRAQFEKKYGAFDQLVVTMLGGGVAADRSLQLNMISNHLESRKNILHLAVTWPTALLNPHLASYRNTHLVRTHHAQILASISDLYISAVGYNSFHEAMYNRVSTIFIAQMSAYMDDQNRRAQAAVSRNLADCVDPEDFTQLLSKIDSHLNGSRGDEIRSALQEVILPPSGISAASTLIREA